MTKDEAIKHCRNGAIAAWVSASMTLIVFAIVYYNDFNGLLAYWDDPWVIADAVLIAGFGYGVYRKSRAAAVGIFIIFLIERIAVILDTGKLTGIGVGLIFLYYFGRAIQGAYVYRHLEREENPGLKHNKVWPFVIGIPLGIVILLLTTQVVLESAGVVPSTAVVSGENIKLNTIAKLKENNILYQDDVVEQFYSYGLFSVLEGGNILTKTHLVIYYQQENEEMAVYELPVEAVEKIEQIQEGGLLEDSQYKVTTSDPDSWLVLELSTESNGDKLFVQALRDKIQPH